MAAPGILHGRDEEVGTLIASIEATAAGRGGVVVLRGDPGIGKSALLAELAHHAVAAGFELRGGRGDEMARARPFGPLAQALGLQPTAEDPEAARIGRILSGQDELDHAGLPLAGEVRFRVLDTVLALVDAATARHPVALVLDDLHWADEDTLRVVVALAERAATVPLLVAVGTRRHPQAPELVTALRALDDLGATVVDVGPLAPSALAEVVTALAGGEPGPRLTAEVSRAGGNPFLAIELVAAHSSAGALFAGGGVVELAPGRGGTPLGDTALRRLDHLRPETVALLRAASVLGRTFELAVVAELVGRRGIAVATDVDEALMAGILHPSGDRLSFVHDLVWEAVYESLPAAVRATLHVEAARVLAARRADAFDVAAQVDRGAAGAGADAVPWLMDGAHQVRVTAPATAAGFLTRALELLPPDDERRPEVQARLAEALVFSGRQLEGHALAEGCLRDEGLDDELRATLGYLLGQALFLEGRLAEAAAQLDTGTRVDGPGRAGALADAGLALLLGGDLATAAETAARALAASRAVGDVAAETYALAVTSWVRALEGDLPDALALGREAVTRADASGRLEAHRNVPYVFYAQVWRWRGSGCCGTAWRSGASTTTCGTSPPTWCAWPCGRAIATGSSGSSPPSTTSAGAPRIRRRRWWRPAVGGWLIETRRRTRKPSLAWPPARPGPGPSNWPCSRPRPPTCTRPPGRRPRPGCCATRPDPCSNGSVPCPSASPGSMPRLRCAGRPRSGGPR